MNMTPEERDYEWRYRFNERIGIMTDGQPPTDRQIQLAKIEADEAIRRLKHAVNGENAP